MILENTLIFVFGLIWGSFLNVVGYRLICDQSLGGRSQCPHCNHQLAWYDTIPLLSWLALRGKCRTCAQPISILYPFIECITGLSAIALKGDGWKFFLPNFILFSALIVTIRTDLEFMLISRYMTLCLIPVGIALSAFGLLPIGPIESILSAAAGYALFFAIAKTFEWFTGRDGIGQGDLDLIALIGAFTGLLGLWMTIMIGSMVGSLASAIYLLASRQERSTHIPFGPFLALGAISYVLFGEQLLQYFI